MDTDESVEKQMGAEGNGPVEKQLAEEHSDYYHEGEHEMTDEEYLFFKSHRLKSDGFDVPAMPKVFSCGMIQPYDITEERQRIEVGRFAQLAIDEYNRRFEVHALAQNGFGKGTAEMRGKKIWSRKANLSWTIEDKFWEGDNEKQGPRESDFN